MQIKNILSLNKANFIVTQTFIKTFVLTRCDSKFINIAMVIKSVS